MGLRSDKEITVYAIQHCHTGRIYVGRTKDLTLRLRAHFGALRNNNHPNELMQRDFNDYGDNYEVFILETIPDEYPIIRDAEYKWMDKLNTGDQRVGYNYKDHHFKASSIDLPEVSPGIPIPNEV